MGESDHMRDLKAAYARGVAAEREAWVLAFRGAQSGPRKEWFREWIRERARLVERAERGEVC